MFFRLTPSEGYEWAFPQRVEDYEVFDRVGTSDAPDPWVPIEMDPIKGRPDWRADFLWLSAGLVMRRSALDAVGDLVAESGDLLPLKEMNGEPLWFLNPRVVPALDEAASEIWRFPNGRIMYAKTPVIIESATEGLNVFKVYPKSSLYASELFATRVRDGRLSGLRFEGLRTVR